MSVEITLYTKSASKSALLKSLFDENFKKTKHFIESMNTPDRLHFMWYGIDDYKSSVGVEATIYKASTEEKSKYKCSDWVLHTRTRASGSYEDKEKQNNVIRNNRKKFGGTFYNDWYGTNKYTNLKDYPKFTPLEKGISIVANNSFEKLRQIRDCLQGYQNNISDQIHGIEDKNLKLLLTNQDPSIILYNSLMPFLVSVLEYFFGQCFVHFIRYDENAKVLIVEEKIRIAVSDVLDILNQGNSLEQIIADTYNFQNLESINKAYKKYLLIDIFTILSKKKRINKRVMRILPLLQEILDARHKFVHELEINYDLTKQDYFDCLTIIEKAIELIIEAFEEKKLNLNIE